MMTQETATLLVQQAGAQLFDQLDDNEVACLRIGMLPYKKTVAAEQQIIDLVPDILETLSKADVGRIMAVAAMQACKDRGPGMVA